VTPGIDLDRLGPQELRARLVSALDGDADAMRTVVARIAPTIQVRVSRALMRHAAQARGRNLRHDVEDMVQEVFAALFSRRGKALRAWDERRGLSFTSFVGLLADREVGMIMRTGKRNPWTEDPTLDERLDEMRGTAASHEDYVASRELLALIAERLKERLSPRGRVYFQRLYIDEQPIQLVAEEEGTTPTALYSWRNRLLKLVRELEAELAAEGPGRV
jgi:RNA polymerase sigma factor (sigma-70 family)